MAFRLPLRSLSRVVARRRFVPSGSLSRLSYATLAEVKIDDSPEVKYNQVFVNNKFVDSVSGKVFPTINPSTGEKICDVAEGDKLKNNRIYKQAPYKQLQPLQTTRKRRQPEDAANTNRLGTV